MNVFFHQHAKEELADSLDYYGNISKNLRTRLRKEVRQTLNQISEFPDMYPVANQKIRKANLQIFPYKILYSIQKERITIVAFAHFKQKPKY